MSMGLYVHIPFCVSKCPYCDFVSYGQDQYNEEDLEAYLACLLQEAELYRRELRGEELKIETLYIGGGTPTCLSGGQLFALLDSLQKTYCLQTGAEVSVEANPGTLTRDKLLALLSGGCNRLSLGVQSFKERELKTLGRIHTPQEAVDAYRTARKAGFANISIDLMYGLPGQDPDDFLTDLKIAVSLGPEHLSLYQLNIEEGTPFYSLREKGVLPETAEETALLIYETAISYLAKEGYRHYEISNFALDGKESRHNQLYWRRQDYLGLGAGASGYLRGVRYANEGSLVAYRAALKRKERPVAEEERLDRETAMAEFMFLGLRLLAGVSKKEFLHNFGESINEVYQDTLSSLKQQELLAESDDAVYLTAKGLYLANVVFMAFLR